MVRDGWCIPVWKLDDGTILSESRSRQYRWENWGGSKWAYFLSE
jgi:hypothetical protein